MSATDVTTVNGGSDSGDGGEETVDLNRDPFERIANRETEHYEINRSVKLPLIRREIRFTQLSHLRVKSCFYRPDRWN